jgi:aminocarboxymuconate-semialdehyde decarboxylase
MGAIELHAHLAAGDPSSVPPFMAALFDVDRYLASQEAAGIELTVLSNALTEVPSDGDELGEARKQHDFLAETIAQHPDRFKALAGVNPFGGGEWLEEGERALDAGLSGFVFPASREDRYLDEPEAQDAFALAEERGALVFIHPAEAPITAEQAGDPMLAMWIGRVYDTGIALSRMLMADTLARYPKLKVLVAHAGGVTPMMLGRLEQVHETFKRRAAIQARMGGGGPPGGATATAPALEPALDDPGPSARVDQLYLDTACYHPAGVAAAIAMVGPDRVVLGSDHPPVDQSPNASVELIKSMEIDDADRDKILSLNARRLLEI